jgi:hypothetical protein
MGHIWLKNKEGRMQKWRTFEETDIEKYAERLEEDAVIKIADVIASAIVAKILVERLIDPKYAPERLERKMMSGR